MKLLLALFYIIFNMHNLYAVVDLPSDEIVDGPMIDGPVSQVCSNPCLTFYKDFEDVGDTPVVTVPTLYDASCCDNCSSCSGFASTTSTNTTTHVVTTSRKGVYESRRVTSGDKTTIYCACTTKVISYSCQSGYYGAPRSDTSGQCKKCPDNATCLGGLTFSCDSGYEKNETATECIPICDNNTFFYNKSCLPCPSNATCSDNKFQCLDGYYYASNSSAPYCVPCPEHASVCSGVTVNDIMCQSGYYMVNKVVTLSSGASVAGRDCKVCPANASCAGGTKTFQCDDGFYKSSTVATECTKCPNGGVTGVVGATSVSQCKLVDGGTYFDNTGSYTISGGGCTYELTTAI